MLATSRVRLLPIVTVLALVAGNVPAGPRCAGRHWVGVWAASPSDAANDGFTEQSLRLIVTPTLRGRRVRVRLSNRLGPRPVTFAASWIARRESGATLVPRSSRRLRFGGRRTVTIPAGEEVVSDSVLLHFEPFQDLAVSMHVRGASGPATEHALALQTSYASPPGSGDHTAEHAGDAFTVDSGRRRTSWASRSARPITWARSSRWAIRLPTGQGAPRISTSATRTFSPGACWPRARDTRACRC
jgi:hypothetical protein